MGIAGQSCTSLTEGMVSKGQTDVAVEDTLTPVQRSLPVAVTVSMISQQSSGARKLPVKLAEAPGASVMGPMTGVLFVGWLSTTNTFTKVTLPVFRTKPV